MSDRHRPVYHFSPNNWMNDPKPFYWNGEYHVFFQHYPHGAYWNSMHWGHARSRDLVHWEQLPIALYPGPDDYDKEGCWTGCVLRHEGRFHILYTGVSCLKPLAQVQCLASSDDLISWTKYGRNPVVGIQPEGFGECFRDPQAWREDDAWYMVVGSEQSAKKGGAALLYRSRDIQQWEYLQPLCYGQTAETGFDFECPDFFPLGGQHVFISSRGRTWWQTGEYTSDRRFVPRRLGATDGEMFYAAKTLLDERGRRILFGWIREGRSSEAQKAAGWSGVLSLPRVLSVLADGSLGMEPAEELLSLRGGQHVVGAMELSADGTPALLDDVRGDALELVARFDPAGAEEVGLRVRCSADGQEYSDIIYNTRTQRLNNVELKLAAGEELVLRVYVDRSVIETFANGRACSTQRIYPERDDSTRVAVWARGGRARLKGLQAWEMAR